MDVNETKQWIIERIDYKHDNYLEELGINEGRYDQWSASIDKWVKNGRNYIFSVIGGGLSVLLGLLSANLLNPFLFYISLAIIVTCAVLTFSISNKISSLLAGFTDTISQLAINGQDMISQSRNYFTSLSVNLDKLGVEDLQKYSVFVEILLNATMVPILIAYLLFFKARWIPKETAKLMKDNISALKNQIEYAHNISSNLNNPIFPTFLVGFIKSQFAEYEKFQKSKM